MPRRARVWAALRREFGGGKHRRLPELEFRPLKRSAQMMRSAKIVHF